VIDWSKLTSGGSTPAVGPDSAAAPVAPAVPGGIPQAPQVAPEQQKFATGQFTPGEEGMTQEQVDKLSAFDRIGRGWDEVGNFLFGDKSILHDTPVASAAGLVGKAVGSTVDATVIKPFQGAGMLASGIPLGWLPGGADDTFKQLGDWAKANDPKLYAQWQAVDAAAAGNWDAGNLHAQFNTETLQYLDDQQKDSFLGVNPAAHFGRAGSGSLGGALSNALSWLTGGASNISQQALGGAGLFNPEGSTASFEQMLAYHKNPGAYTPAAKPTESAEYAFKQMDAGKFTEQQARDYIAQSERPMSRVEESAMRLDRGGEVSDVEKNAIEAWRSGAWTLDHANTYIETHGQGITRNPAGQIAGTVLTDPLTYATIGAGSIAKTGEVGAQIAEAAGLGKTATMADRLALAGQQASAYEKLATTVHAVQADPVMGPVFRLARGMIDPLGTFKPGSVASAVTNLEGATAVSAFSRWVKPTNFKDMRGLARELGKTPEVDSAIMSYSLDKAHEMQAVYAQQQLLREGLGEQLIRPDAPSVDSLAGPMARNAGVDAETELVDHMQAVGKTTLTSQEERDTAARLAVTLGQDVPFWEAKLAKMPFDMKAAWHAVAYKLAEKDSVEALAKIDQLAYKGDLPLKNAVLMNTDSLDNEIATGLAQNIKDILAAPGTGNRIEAATAEWNAAAQHYPAIASIGLAPGGQTQLEALVKELERQLKSGGITKRWTEAELQDASVKPVSDFLARHSFEGKPLWKMGFRPDEEVAWGLKRDLNTGKVMVDRTPTISHVIDAVPGRQPFSDTIRDSLGRIIGKSTAGRLAAPVDSLSAFIDTMRDGITGQRLVRNIEQRFERSTFEAGIPKPVSKAIMEQAKEIAGLNRTTLRGLGVDEGGNLWNAVHDAIPRDLVLKDGSSLNVHIVMDHLLQAAEGDLRIMGATSVLSQRMRNAIRHGIGPIPGDPSNWLGRTTVTGYNRIRYSQPMFLIQRITDGPYYSILYGVTPVGKGALTGGAADLEKIVENIGRTSFGRDFSMDMPEFATRTNFLQGIKSAFQEAGITSNKMQAIIDAPDAIIAHNMTNMLHAKLGDIVRGSLDNLATLAKDAEPELQADMLAAGEQFKNTFADWRQVYSDAAGRVLNDNEVALQYIKEQLNAWNRVVTPEGLQDFERILADGERSMPASIGELGTIKPDLLAQKLGYEDAAALRRDVTGRVEKINGTFQVVNGEHDISRLEEDLRDKLMAHPDYVKRAIAYFSGTWDDFWHQLARPVGEGGLDISAHYAKEAQNLIAGIAKDRGMDPWEYLSGVMAMNLGPNDLNTAMGRLAAFLKQGDMAPGDWAQFFRAHLDPSAQETLMDAAAGRTGLAGSIETKLAAGDVAGSQADNVAQGASKGGTLESGGATIQTGSDILSQAEEDANALRDKIAQKWQDTEQRNSLRMEKDLHALEQQGFDIHDAEDALGDYNGIERSEFTAEEYGSREDAADAYRQEREDKRQEILDAIDAAEHNHTDATQAAADAADAAAAQAPSRRIDLSQMQFEQPKTTVPGRTAEADAFFSGADDSGLVKLLKDRVASGKPHENADVEAALQEVSRLSKKVLAGSADAGNTRHNLRQLVEDVAATVPTTSAAPFNRTHALIVSLLRSKIMDAQKDIFRLAEMQTKRNVIERSLNHPLFGLYPASYMWGKVLPETVKFFAKNPYAATYTIADVERAIAIQREYDRNTEDLINKVDRSSAAFLLDYLTPSLPWSDHSARMSPMVRDLFKGQPQNIWLDELATVSPERWVKQFAQTGVEALNFVKSQQHPQEGTPIQLGGLQSIENANPPTGGTGPVPQITGPVSASGLAPILSEDLSRLQDILLHGQPAGQ